MHATKVLCEVYVARCVQEAHQRQSRQGRSNPMPVAYGSPAPLDYNLINIIIFQQHCREACVPAMHEGEEHPLRGLVRSNSNRSVQSSPASDNMSASMPSAPRVPVQGSPVRFLMFE